MTERVTCAACAGRGWTIVAFPHVRHRPGSRYGEVCPRCRGLGTVPVRPLAEPPDRSQPWREQIGADIEQERAKR